MTTLFIHPKMNPEESTGTSTQATPSNLMNPEMCLSPQARLPPRRLHEDKRGK